jgi:uncharacterized protein (TIGR02145 family)
MEVDSMLNKLKYTLTGFLMITLSCTVNDTGPDHHIPTLSPMTIVSIGQTTARCRSNVVSDGGTAVTEKGVCWSTDTLPTIHTARTIDGSGTGEYFSNITGLIPNTRYYARSYAINDIGLNYDTLRTFTTLNYGGTIIINKDPDSLEITWQLDGPNDNDYSGSRDTFLVNMVPGSYRMSWSPIRGWSSPPIQSSNLISGATITFSGVYQRIFGSDSTGTVTDADGNVYRTVKIGEQWWMAENLRVAHYRTDETIPRVTDGFDWGEMRTGAYCDYNNDTTSAAIYGHLYNWYAASNANIAPDGWHVPERQDWDELIAFLGDPDQAGGRLKETGFQHWITPNTGATNETGFTGLPGGMRSDTNGQFLYRGNIGYFWSRTENQVFEAESFYLVWVSGGIDVWQSEKYEGCSIRCVKD